MNEKIEIPGCFGSDQLDQSDRCKMCDYRRLCKYVAERYIARLVVLQSIERMETVLKE